MEITSKKLIDLLQIQVQKTYSIDVKKLTRFENCFKTDKKSMSFVSNGNIGLVLLCNLPNMQFGYICCVYDTMTSKWYQLSVYASTNLFKGTVFLTSLNFKKNEMYLEIFDIIMFEGKNCFKEQYAQRFEKIVENVVTNKKKNVVQDNGKLKVYNHKNGVLKVQLDVMNMFTDFSSIQKHYKDRLIAGKNLFGTISNMTNKFEYFKQSLK